MRKSSASYSQPRAIVTAGNTDRDYRLAKDPAYAWENFVAFGAATVIAPVLGYHYFAKTGLVVGLIAAVPLVVTAIDSFQFAFLGTAALEG